MTYSYVDSLYLKFCCILGELSGPSAELLIQFHTSKEKRKYTIQTHDTIVALLGKTITFLCHQHNIIINVCMYDIIIIKYGSTYSRD